MRGNWKWKCVGGYLLGELGVAGVLDSSVSYLI